MKRRSQKNLKNPNRRKFLGASTAGLAAAAITPTVLAQSNSEVADPNHYDVIVIGAGFAGVTAARDASWLGHKTLILEARPRLGGRCFTSSFGGHSDVDFGGKWVGWSQPHVWAEIMRYGIEVDESAALARATNQIWMENGQRVDGDPAQYGAMFDHGANVFYEPSREAFPRPFDPLFNQEHQELDSISAAEALADMDLEPTIKDLMTSFTAINGHSDPSESSYYDQLRWFSLSNFSLVNMWDNVGRYRIKGGTKTLIEAMQESSNAELKLANPVSSISQDENGVTVNTRRNETYTAKAVILALPLNCVADIEFSPAISETKIRVSQERHTGSGTKVYARIEADQPVMSGHGTIDMPLNFIWTEYDDPESHILVGFGTSPSTLDINNNDAVSDAVQRYLPDAQLIESFGYDWNLDPYSKGTWCMYRPNVFTQDFEELRQAEGRLHFAGGDIALGWRGFIDGAIETGMTTAKAVHEQISQA
jgi:pseudooxynicotine oxidase